MKKLTTHFLVRMNFALALTIFLAAGSAKAQEFPDGLIGLSSTDPGAVYQISESTGQATIITTLDRETSLVGAAFLGEILFGTDLCADESCDTYVVASIARNGTTIPISNQNGSSNWWALAADHSAGVLYSVDTEDSNVLVVQFPNGTIQTIGSGLGFDGAGLAYDDTNAILYVVGNNASLYTVSISTGTASLIGPTGLSATNNFGLEYDECNQVLYLNDGNTAQLYTVDVNTGAATLVGSNNVDDVRIDGLAWKGNCGPIPPSPIPTMSEWGLIAMAAIMGMAGILFYRKRRLAA